MSTEWKPGNVGLVPFSNADEVGIFTHGGWVTRLNVNPLGYWDVRPLVVIDPEDREQVERLAVAYTLIHNYSGTPWEDREKVNRDRVIDALSTALREFANPKPPRCGAHVNLAGEDFQCVEPPEHGGGHRNPDAEAVWGEPE